MISGFWNVSPSPKTNYFYLWRHQDTATKPRKPLEHLKKMVVATIISINPKVWKCSNRRAPDNPEDPSNEILKVLDTGSISINKHEMEIR